MSARQIAFLSGCTHSAINNALNKYGIPKKHRKAGWVEYGYKMVGGRRVPHIRQQKIIKQVLRRKRAGWSNAKVASWLNSKAVPASSKNSKWYPSTVGRLMQRTKS